MQNTVETEMNPPVEREAAKRFSDAASTGALEPVAPLVPELDADPFDGIPPQLLDSVGSYDRDTAGGCG